MQGLAKDLLYRQAIPGQTGSSKEVSPELDRWLSERLEPGIDVIRSMVLLKCEEGEEKYGTRLHTFNGRDPLVDLAQELVDGLQYAHQARMEAFAKGRNSVVAAMELTCGDLVRSLSRVIALKQKKVNP